MPTIRTAVRIPTATTAMRSCVTDARAADRRGRDVSNWMFDPNPIAPVREQWYRVVEELRTRSMR